MPPSRRLFCSPVHSIHSTTVPSTPSDLVPLTHEELATPKRNHSPSRSPSPCPRKRARLDASSFDDDDGIESDEVIDEEENGSYSNQPDAELLMPFSEKELLFTVCYSKNIIYFVAPFAPVPMIMRCKFPPRKDQINNLLERGFKHTRNLKDKKRFRNIGFYYELTSSADRSRTLVQFTIDRIKRMRTDRDYKRQMAREDNRDKKRRLSDFREKFSINRQSDNSDSDDSSVENDTTKGSEDITEEGELAEILDNAFINDSKLFANEQDEQMSDGEEERGGATITQRASEPRKHRKVPSNDQTTWAKFSKWMKTPYRLAKSIGGRMIWKRKYDISY